MAEKGNAAYEKLRIFAKGFVTENGFHLNGDFKNYGFCQWHYRPFTLESLFGYCDALQELLLQEHQGYVHLFPTLPADWWGNEVSFDKLRSYGGVLVSAKWKKGKTVGLTLRFPRRMTLRIKNTFGVSSVTLSQGGDVQTLSDVDGYFLVEGKRGTATFAI